ESARRWKQLQDLYIVQTLGCHPPNCLEGDPSAERIIEAVERIEEDLTDVATIHGPLHLVIEVGDAIAVEPQRPRDGRGDPLLDAVSNSLKDMLKNIKPTPEN